jgi:hypothetical protein
MRKKKQTSRVNALGSLRSTDGHAAKPFHQHTCLACRTPPAAPKHTNTPHCDGYWPRACTGTRMRVTNHSQSAPGRPGLPFSWRCHLESSPPTGILPNLQRTVCRSWHLVHRQNTYKLDGTHRMVAYKQTAHQLLQAALQIAQQSC